MKPITIFFIILLISLIIISSIPYTSEAFTETVNNDINLNLKLNNNIPVRRPRVIVPIYAPWRMYYPYESVYSNIGVGPWLPQTSPFYPFFDQYNIYQNMIPY
jgi:hypothetical protein